MSETPRAPQPTFGLEPAPGAKGAKICGILSICFALTCLGIPVAIILGIVALVQQSKAKRIAQAEPGRFAPVPATGLVTGIIGLVLPLVMLPFVGIVSAIAVPALLGQRELAREKAVQAMVNQAAQEVTMGALGLPTGRDGKPEPKAVVATLLAKPEFQLPMAKNPYNPMECPFVAADAPDHDGQIALKAGFRKGEDGQMHPAVQIQGQVKRKGQRDVITKVVDLD